MEAPEAKLVLQSITHNNKQCALEEHKMRLNPRQLEMEQHRPEYILLPAWSENMERQDRILDNKLSDFAPITTERVSDSTETDSASTTSAENTRFLFQDSRSRRESKITSLRRKLFQLWAYVLIGAILIIGLLFVFTYVVVPAASIPLTSRNFISNNPIGTSKDSNIGVSRWLEDFSHSAIPVSCHSHNDYTRPWPLFSALAAGCASTEADVWLSPDGKDLLVGHHRKSLSPDRTLKSLYIDPLMEILNTINPESIWNNFSRTDQANGVFRTQPEATLILFIDVKDDASKTWPLVLEQLEPLRQKLFLTRHEEINSTEQELWPGPVTIVGTGNILNRRDVSIGQDLDQWNAYHDAFLDALLDKLPTDDRRDEFYAASVSFKKTIGSVFAGFSKKQLYKLRDQIDSAQQKGLKVRYWDTPSWPISHRDYVWRTLIKEGVDLLNADDVQSAAKRDWSRGYERETIWLAVVSVHILITSGVVLWVVHRAIQKYERRLKDEGSIRV